MAASAASTGRRKRLEKDREKRREALRKKRQARAKRAEQAFNKISDDGAVLREDQLEDFLSEVVQVPRNKLEADAVELVISTARGGADDSERGVSDVLAKSALLGAVEKYGEYVRKSKDIDDIFEKFDANKDGVLSRSELKKALKAHEKKADRKVKGVQAKLFIDESDIDFILEQSDADNSGAVSRSELLPAIAAWEELAAIKIEKRKKGGCTIS